MNTLDNITSLGDKEIFIFGSNGNGYHAGGAARQALEQFGAVWGIAEGLSGKTYAFPTLNRNMRKRNIKSLEDSRNKLFVTAEALPEYTFLLTKVGCGIAGFKEEKMAELFSECPDNIVKPEGWK